MTAVGRFEIVSREQFEADFEGCMGKKPCADTYTDIMLPKRATSASAGYDFHTPTDITLCPGQSVRIPTGIRAKISRGWFLAIFVRSSMGFSYRLQLDNTVGIIDSDYYNAKNQGHIMIQVTNDSKSGKVLQMAKGDRFAQGIFIPFGVTEDDDATGERTGGFGSTN